MDDVDKALEALKVQIKKEIVDNSFAGRVELEEEVQDFREEVAAYQAEYGTLAHHFLAFYQAKPADGPAHRNSRQEVPRE